MDNQNALQGGFTEDTTPLICDLIMEELERENKDLKKNNIYWIIGWKI